MAILLAIPPVPIMLEWLALNEAEQDIASSEKKVENLRAPEKGSEALNVEDSYVQVYHRCLDDCQS